MTVDFDKVSSAMREVAEQVIMPRFRKLSADQIEEKAKDDFVTVADKEAEELLTPILLDLAPGSIVVGEEATAVNPDLLENVKTDGAVWYVDPIDGTSLFIEGKPDFGTMIAYAEKGEVVQSAIFLPAINELFLAERGAGAFLITADDETIRLQPRNGPAAVSEARAALYTRHFPSSWDKKLERLRAQVMSAHSAMCSAKEYTDIARGAKDLATYYRMLPWDHAPGSLILREAGGVIRNLETQADYQPVHLQGPHVLASNEELWQAARHVMR
ncbi:MAG: inositol monophosphatase [Rhodobiaceae bacterium]|nr:MAG: inositol monophosphatase [Rhodobiaceae bacterium]